MRRRKAPARKRVREESAPSYLTAVPHRLLLDTHVWLWWRADDSGLGPRARGAIREAAEVYVSAATAWEIAIKTGIGKLRFPDLHVMPDSIERLGVLSLSITMEHAVGVAALPKVHGDPFDRILAAQALAENLTLVTADRVFARYGVAVLDATK